MRIIARRQQPTLGEAVGGIAAAGAVTAAGAPELIPVAAPIGAQAGKFVETKTKEIIKKEDPVIVGKCEDLNNLKFLWDEEMNRVLRLIAMGNYEEAERHVAELIILDARIMNAVNCYEANAKATTKGGILTP